MGWWFPGSAIIDNMRLEASEYCFKIKGVEVGRGVIRLGYFMASIPAA
jgi:flagellar biosynthesis protein FlhA